MTKWTQTTPPIKAQISDSFTSIDAIVTGDCAARFQKEARKSLTQNTAGAILTLTEFEIVIGYLNPSSPDISLCIKDFGINGCEGTGTLGRPISITKRPETTEVVKEYVQAKRENEYNQSTENERSSISQECFASQVIINPPMQHTVAQTPNSTMLSKLNLKNSLPFLNSKDPMPSRKELSPHLNAPGHQSASLPLSSDPFVNNGAGTDQRVNTSQGLSREKRNSLPIYQHHWGTPINFGNNVQQPTEETANIPPKDENTRPGDHTSIQENTLRPIERRNDPWRGMKRIRRRDVVIPKEQEELIEVPDSWIPPETGKRFPRAHVPIMLLKHWNELQFQMRQSRDGQQERQVDLPDQIMSQTQSQITSSTPDDPLSEADWSVTPTQRTLVPPDSSPPWESCATQRPVPERTVENNREKNNESSRESLSERDHASNDENPISDVDPYSQRELYDNSESEMDTMVPRGRDSVSRSPDMSADEEASSPRRRALDSGGDFLNWMERSPFVPSQGYDGHERDRTPENHDNPSHSAGNKLASDDLIPATMESYESVKVPRSAAAQQSANAPTELRPPNRGDHTQNTNSQYVEETRLSVVAPDGAETASSKCSSSVSTYSFSGDRGKKRRQSQLLSSTDGSSPPKRPSKRVLASIDIPSRSETNNTNHPPLPLKETKAIYDKFKQAYPSHEGDLDMFRISCQKLQSLRGQGQLQRSVLWDDFFCREAFEYRDYVSKCREAQVQAEPYESYFTKNVKKPQFKKRSLTSKNINSIISEINTGLETASVHSGRNEAEAVPSPAKEQQMANDGENAPQVSITCEATLIPESPPREQQKLQSIPETPAAESASEYEYHETASVELGDDRAGYMSDLHLDYDDDDDAVDNDDTLMADDEGDVTHDEHGYEDLYSSDPRPFYPPPDPTTASQTSPHHNHSKEPRQWFHDPNTKFKMFARSYTNLKSERGYYSNGQKKEPVPRDSQGVIIPEPLHPQSQLDGERVSGTMNSMGWGF